MHYEFFFERAGKASALPVDFAAKAELDVLPTVYRDRTELFLPLKGKIIVWDGHDYYSHHRRLPVSMPEMQQKGLRSHSNRYAYDFIPLGPDDQLYQGDLYQAAHWYGYGAPIFAPGPGTVISSANDVADNWYEGHDVKHPVGDDHNGLDNHVIIDHGDGEYSLLCHMKPGTVRVKTGDRVKRGQQLGQIGFSGDSFLPHLHYTLMSGPKQFSSEAEGLPSYFHKVRRVLGSNAREVSGKIDSGDIVESAR